MTRRGRGGRELTLRGAVIGSIAVLVAATLLSAGVSVWERQRLGVVQSELRNRLRPAQTAVVDLTRAYVDQETGQRGFALTGRRSFLQPYEDGRRDADRLHELLGELLQHDPQSRPLLDAAVAAGESWQREAAEPEIAARERGPVRAAESLALALRGKQLFDTLRSRLGEVGARVELLTRERLADVQRAQDRANVVTALAALVAVGMAGWTALALPRLASRPILRLLRELTAVAGGDTGRQITVGGPVEVRAIAGAAETMRTSLVSSSAALATAQQQMGVVGERERMARQVGDHTLHRLYDLTLGLSGLHGRSPELAEAVRPLVDQTDAIARELRGIIYPLPGDREAPEVERGSAG